MKHIFYSLIAFSALATGAAQAGSSSGAFNVNATVTAGCEIVGGSIVFPDTGLLGAAGTPEAARAAGTVQLNCTGAIPFTIQAGTSGALSDVDLTGPSNNAVRVALYADNGYTQKMTTGSASAPDITGTSAGGAENITIYGEAYRYGVRFPAPGLYSGAAALSVVF